MNNNIPIIIATIIINLVIIILIMSTVHYSNNYEYLLQCQAKAKPTNSYYEIINSECVINK
jgi:hypothetical protein